MKSYEVLPQYTFKGDPLVIKGRGTPTFVYGDFEFSLGEIKALIYANRYKGKVAAEKLGIAHNTLRAQLSHLRNRNNCLALIDTTLKAEKYGLLSEICHLALVGIAKEKGYNLKK
jgi:hypothetical protein